MALFTKSDTDIAGVVLSAILTASLLSRPQAGFALMFVGLAFILWLPYCLYFMWVKPKLRRIQALKMGIWLLAMLSIWAIHHYRAQQYQKEADAIVAVIQDFRVANGHCPSSLVELGMNPQQLREQLGVVHYACDDLGPQFFYGDTWMVFSMHYYDFTQKIWLTEAS